MRTIIAGSRTLADYEYVKRAVKNSGFKITTVLCGMCPDGIDLLGLRYAKDNGIPWEEYPAEWTKQGYYNPRAGFERNYTMALNADALIAIWDGESRGTQDMINVATRENLDVYLMRAE